MNEELLLFELTQKDPRYPVEAYNFVREALSYAADTMELDLPAAELGSYDEMGEPTVERHFTGQQLCEAIRRYAISQFGYLAKVVLKSWNIHTTTGFGDLVYNMIDAGIMKKSEQDRREDFDGVYQFDEVFETEIEINSTTALL